MPDPVGPTLVRAGMLGQWLLYSALMEAVSRGCWSVGPSATRQHSVAAVGCPVCVWAAHDPRPAKSHKHASPVQGPALFGLFSPLLVVFFLVICLLKIGSSSSPSGAPSIAKQRSDEKLQVVMAFQSSKLL